MKDNEKIIELAEKLKKLKDTEQTFVLGLIEGMKLAKIIKK